MKKVLVAFDGAHFPSAILDFVLELHNSSPIVLTGVFLPSVDYSEAMSYSYYGNAIAPLYLEEYESDAVSIKKNIALFEDFCNKHHIRHKIHQDIKGAVAKGIQRETRYADLLVLSSKYFYENLGDMIQEEYLTDTLHKAECPVVLLPETYTTPDNVILAYDGSAASMHAIRQFIYLLPQYANLNTLVMHADDDDEDLPSLSLIKEYAAQHFNKLAYYQLNADPKKYFNTWIANKGSAMVISGSYGRSAFSEFFRKNFLKDIVKEQQVPLFIAHL